MTELNTRVTWVDARVRLPRSGTPVAAAITGRYPPDDPAEAGTATTAAAVPAASAVTAAQGEEFWLVRPMYFTTLHRSEDGTEHRDCFVDSDGIVRLPHGLAGDETVTHWAELPTLPGGTTHAMLGEDARTGLRNAWDTAPDPA